MKITESQLRKIIREELEAVREADDGIQIGSIKGRFSKKFGSRLQKVLAIKAKKKEELGRDPTSDELQDAMRAAGMKDPDEEAPMDEEKLEPGLDVIANLFKDYRAKYGVNFDRFLFYVRQMLKKEGIDAKQLANKQDMKATISSIAQDAGAMLKMAKKKDRLPLRR